MRGGPGRGSYSFVPLSWYAASTDPRTSLPILPASSLSYRFTSALASLQNANKAFNPQGIRVK